MNKKGLVLNGLQVMVMLLILFILWVVVTTYAVIGTGKLVDENGGLKAVIERVWEGNEEERK